MAETLGSICDKLATVKLKIYHTEDEARLASLAQQEIQLIAEIDEYITNALSGSIPSNQLSFAANKVYQVKGNEITPATGSIASIFAELAEVNCLLWHEQEKVYDFASVPVHEKDMVVKNLALYNLRRNDCIDSINRELESLVQTARQSQQAQ
jgi:hypothetical protein